MHPLLYTVYSKLGEASSQLDLLSGVKPSSGLMADQLCHLSTMAMELELRRDIDVGRLGSSPQIRPARARGVADPATRAPARTAAPHTLWSDPTGPRLRQASAACWAALTAAPALSAAALTCNRTPAAVGRVLGAERGRQTAHSRRWGRCDGGFADAPVVAPSRAGNRPSPQLRRRLAPGLRSLPS